MAFFKRRQKEEGSAARSSESATASVFSFLLELLRAIMGFFRNRNDRKDELEEQIRLKEQALSEAIQQGRITDAGILRQELERLKAQRGLSASAAAGHMVVLAACLLCTGCFSTKKPANVVVVGERINIVKPGDDLTVPQLIPPAKTWYLVDDVGLNSWLGISVLGGPSE